MNRRTRGAIVSVIALSLVAAACGDDSEEWEDADDGSDGPPTYCWESG